MGADLYINSIFEENNKKYDTLFNKYVAIRDAALKRIPERIQSILRECKAKNRPVPAHFDKSYVKDFKISEDAQKKVHLYYNRMYSKGYFRDSYNSTSVLKVLGLSWWQDIKKLQDKKGNMSPANAEKFITLIRSRKLNLPTRKTLEDWHCTVDDKENSVEGWHKMYKRSRLELLRFLNTAIRLGESIRCST